MRADLAYVQEDAYNPETICVGMARIGSQDQKIVAGSMKAVSAVDFGTPLHSLVIAGNLHVMEEEILDIYKLQAEQQRHGL